MRQTFKLLVACIGMACSVASAQVTEATVSADGSGMTRDEAIAAAVASAAGQAFGIELEAATVTETWGAEVTTNDKSDTAMVSAVNRVVKQAVNSPVNSPILGYTVDNVSQGIANTWDASVTLRYAKFEKIGADTNRRSIIVVSNDKRYRDLITDTVSEALVNSRRFDVLNRKNTNLFDAEKDFITGGDAGMAEMARLSQASGADYLVVAEIQGLGISNNMRETIRMTGEVLVKSAVSGTLRLQVVEFATRKVKWSSSEKFGGTYEGVSSIGAGTLSKLIGGAADKLMEKLVVSIYPIRVVKVMGDVAIINRGEGSVAKGETYAVFLMGEELTDPQSGESLGSMEVEIGIGEITEVKPKFSFLKMGNGPLGVSGDYIVRKSSKKIAASAAKKPQKVKSAALKKPEQPSRKDVFLN
jgi:curli biogenesis system outer membrane secretion channel CsgG